MTSSFEDREAAFENKFLHDQQLQFRVEAKACKAFGLWIAAQIGLNEQEAHDYANDMVVANLDKPGLDDVIDLSEADLTARGQGIARERLKSVLDQFVQEAKRAVMQDVLP